MGSRSPKSIERTNGVKSVLLLQCCHLAQWFFVAQRLRALYPAWKIEGLCIDHPDLHYFLNRLESFDSAYFFPSEVGELTGQYDLIVFPLLNRGYARLKKSGLNLPGDKFSVDYEGNIAPVDRPTVLKSVLRPLFEPTPGFVTFFEDFPPPPLGDQVLLVESCHPSLISKYGKVLSSLNRDKSKITRISDGSLLTHWKSLRDSRFDSAIIFCTSEKGFLGLKLLPYVLRVPRIIVFNEHGSYFVSTYKELARFLYFRFRFGAHFAHNQPKVLLFQTEAAPYIKAALKSLRKKQLFPECKIYLLCREENRNTFEKESGVEEVLTFSKKGTASEIGRLRRQINRIDPDINCGIFTGRSVFLKQKAGFLFLGARKKLVFNAGLDSFWLSTGNLPKMIRREPLLYGLDLAERRGKKIVLYQTESAEYVLRAAKEIQKSKLYPQPKLLLVCTNRDSSYLSERIEACEVLTFSKHQSLKKTWELLEQIRKFDSDIKVAVFSGRPVFRASKLLYFFSRSKRRLALNARLDAYWLSPWTFFRVFHKEPLLPGLDVAAREGQRVLILQTETAEYTKESILRLQAVDLFPKPKILLICREDDRDFLSGLPGIESVETYDSRSGLQDVWKLIVSTWRFRAHVKIGVFTGRRSFIRSKGLYLFARARKSFVFNAQLDGYWLGLRTFLRVFRKEPLLFGSPDQVANQVLLFETEAPELVTQAARTVHEPHVVPKACVTVFCRADRAALYQASPFVQRTLTYSKESPVEYLRSLWELSRFRPAVLSAVFSGRRIFLKQKILFWLIPSKSRLAFNESLDCLYVTRKTFGRLFQRDQENESSSATGFRLLLKGLLFLPRFAFLLCWLGFIRLRRAYTLSRR